MSLKAVHEYSNEILIIEAQNDEFIPKQTIENYKNAINDKSKLTYVLMEDADHSIKQGDSHQRYITILHDWFAGKI
jgi:uncharacterized protein